MTGDAGFMLTERAANLREGPLFGVVETEPFPLPGFESCESFAQGTAKHGDVALTMRIVRMELGPRMRPLARIVCVVFAQLFEAATYANRINVALSENGAEPGLQRTAPVVVAEKRTSAALAIRETVQIREKRIREFTRFGRP
jgi:hypothetical protein